MSTQPWPDITATKSNFLAIELLHKALQERMCWPKGSLFRLSRGGSKYNGEYQYGYFLNYFWYYSNLFDYCLFDGYNSIEEINDSSDRTTRWLKPNYRQIIAESKDYHTLTSSLRLTCRDIYNYMGEPLIKLSEHNSRPYLMRKWAIQRMKLLDLLTAKTATQDFSFAWKSKIWSKRYDEPETYIEDDDGSNYFEVWLISPSRYHAQVMYHGILRSFITYNMRFSGTVNLVFIRRTFVINDEPFFNFGLPFASEKSFIADEFVVDHDPSYGESIDVTPSWTKSFDWHSAPKPNNEGEIFIQQEEIIADTSNNITYSGGL